jgi:hypothetical protein
MFLCAAAVEQGSGVARDLPGSCGDGIAMKARLLLSAASALLATLTFSTGVLAGGGELKHAMRTRFAPAQLAPAPGDNLYSHGGNVETQPLVYLSYWGPEWARGFTTGGYSSVRAQAYVNGFFTSLGGSRWLKSTTQYCQRVPVGAVSCPAGAQMVTNPPRLLQGVWNDGSHVPSTPSSASIASAAQRAVAHFGYDRNATYMVFTPAGKSTFGFSRYYCAWHAQTSYRGQPVAFVNVPYQPDGGAGCGKNYVNRANDSFGHGYFDGFSIVAGHEYAETVTDPAPNTAAGWLDSFGGENGDKCAWGQGPGPQAASQNLTLGGQKYAVQPLWSNSANRGAGGCTMG